MERVSCGREVGERVIIVHNRPVCVDFDVIMKIEWFCGQLQGLKSRLLRRFRRRWGQIGSLDFASPRACARARVRARYLYIECRWQHLSHLPSNP